MQTSPNVWRYRAVVTVVDDKKHPVADARVAGYFIQVWP
jgi:hypothetical protein